MPLFKDRGLLFVHIPKNAGRSIEAALLGDNGTLASGVRNVLSRIGAGLVEATRSQFVEEYHIGTMDRTFAAQHLTLAEMQWLGLLENVDMATLRSFAVVRNPFDRAVSSVFHFRPGGSGSQPPGSPAEFEGMLEQWLDRPLADHNDRAHRRPQFDYIIDIRGQPAIDNILHFETLESDFNALMQECGCPEVTLDQRGKSNRLQSYQDYFTPSARRLVEREFAADLDQFGYSF